MDPVIIIFFVIPYELARQIWTEPNQNQKNHHPLPDQTVIIVIIRILLSLYGEIYGSGRGNFIHSIQFISKYAMGNYHTYFQYLSLQSFICLSFERSRYIGMDWIHGFNSLPIDRSQEWNFSLNLTNIGRNNYVDCIHFMVTTISYNKQNKTNIIKKWMNEVLYLYL